MGLPIRGERRTNEDKFSNTELRAFTNFARISLC